MKVKRMCLDPMASGMSPVNANEEFYSLGFPFPKHVGPITDALDAKLEAHGHLLERTYDDETKFDRAMRTLADTFNLDVKGTCRGGGKWGYSHDVTVSPKLEGQ